jgi:hypothetical protein
MRNDLPMLLPSAALVLSLLACSQPGPDPAQFTGSAQPGRQASGATFAAPANVPVTAYPGSVRGSNSPLGLEAAPANVPVTAYPGSARGSNSPLGFERKPDQSPGSLPVAP